MCVPTASENLCYSNPVILEPMARVFAAADIGSNTAHLLVAATDGELVMRLDNVNEWIALGEVVARKGEIPVENANELVNAMKEFRRVAGMHSASGLYVFATEALRSAKNSKAVIKRIKEEAGVEVEIISPRREAELSLRGILLDAAGLNPGLLFEVGGGSAQIAKLHDGEILAEESIQLGTGKLIAESGLRNPCPPDALGVANRIVAERLKACPVQPESGQVAVVSGGVARGLWRALHPDGEKKLCIEEIDYLLWAAARLPVDRIVDRFDVKTKRAGTLLAGALIYSALMKRFGVRELIVSEFGVREGAILELSRGKMKPCPV
jgi:exopolyphosphatase/guanosine-5'-triphosphate,3'-diphosphate pyrophosphatase